MPERFITNKKEVTAMSRAELSKRREITLTNDMQVALVKLFRPEVEGKREFNQALMDLIPIHGANFHKIVEVDAQINPDNKLTDLWGENRGQDPHNTLLFIKTQLDTMRVCDSFIESAPDKETKAALRRKFGERLKKSLEERKGIL